MTDRELMQQALEALEYASDATKPEGLNGCECLICKAIPALSERLAQPEQEEELEVLPDLGPVWSSLTNKELETMAEAYVTDCYFDTMKYGQAIQSKLKELNI